MAGMDIRWQIEVDPFCQKVLDLRFPESKKYTDIRSVNGAELEPVDIVAGGFPCQPFRVAGEQRGDQEDRNHWPEMRRIITQVRPNWVVGENVSGLIPLYLDTVLADLESEGYACRTFVFPAHALGAWHRRDRIWIVGYSGESTSQRNARGISGAKEEVRGQGKQDGDLCKRFSNAGEDVPDTHPERLERCRADKYQEGRKEQSQGSSGLFRIFRRWS